MNEELEPLGLPMPAQSEAPQTLSELVAQHPLVAIAASAAVGAGVMALIAAVSHRREPAGSPLESLHAQGGDAYADLRSQLGKLIDRLSASLPSRQAASQTVGDFGAQASKVIDKASGAAKQTFRSASDAARSATETAKAHPLITSLVLGALGTVIASLGAAAQGSPDAAPPTDGEGNDKDAKPATRPAAQAK
jgi:phytoene dehydrogenase-like protein